MGEITELLQAVERGEEGAQGELFARLYDDLKQLATSRMAREPSGHTLQPTALVNETFLRLMGTRSEKSATWDGSHHFFGAAAHAMRRVLIESARRKQSEKRGGGMQRAVLDPDTIGTPQMADHLLALDEALNRYSEIEPRKAELVSLRFFAGLTLKEAAKQLGIAPRTADSDWAYSRAWLLAEMGADSEE